MKSRLNQSLISTINFTIISKFDMTILSQYKDIKVTFSQNVLYHMKDDFFL